MNRSLNSQIKHVQPLSLLISLLSKYGGSPRCWFKQSFQITLGKLANLGVYNGTLQQ